LVIVSRGCQVHFLNVHTLLSAAVAYGALAAGAVNENAAHGFRRSGEEVRAILKLRLTVITHKPHPGFVDKRGGLQGLARRFVGHPVRGQAP
jgi:hypothetical protein